jgi:heterodisulfide reductase subunit A
MATSGGSQPSADVLVVGGGVAGIAAAQTLADRGLDVLLVEKQRRLGGKAAELACMATQRCRRCSACLLEDAVQALQAAPGVHVRVGAGVEEASRTADGFQVGVEPAGEADATVAPLHGTTPSDRERWKVSGVILCTGFEVFDASSKPFLGYGQSDDVVTTLELDHILARQGDRGWDEGEGPPAKVAFVQCVGSRERKEGRGYCSQVCCSVSLRLAGKLLYLHPDMEIAIHYIDLQIQPRSVRSYHGSLADRIELLQGVPGEIITPREGGVVIRSVTEDGSAVEPRTFDKAVLAVGMVPNPATRKLGEMFGLEEGRFGFASGGEPPVLAAGTCVFPKDIPGSMDEARDAADRMARALGGGKEVAHG